MDLFGKFWFSESLKSFFLDCGHFLFRLSDGILGSEFWLVQRSFHVFVSVVFSNYLVVQLIGIFITFLSRDYFFFGTVVVTALILIPGGFLFPVDKPVFYLVEGILLIKCVVELVDIFSEYFASVSDDEPSEEIDYSSSLSSEVD
eukprot:TRINITY_DN7966_c0_g1_i4.p1 TRINITY_DN7966_c0_g1~~TRINITY_DN7966_c0_g1_i4.p1  ORF type:complete len:145 (-),score=37.37 TRINITY_DN7966_c0_g1_i4:108-542(-)